MEINIRDAVQDKPFLNKLNVKNKSTPKSAIPPTLWKCELATNCILNH
jgi:hypothetical protein